MTKLTFSGDPRARGKRKDPPSLTMYGIEFPLDKPVEVDDKLTVPNSTETIVAKLSRHSHFTAEGQQRPEVAGAIPPPPPSQLKAEHRGRGVWAITDGPVELVEGLSKEEANAFNALNDEEKAEYIAAKRGA